MRQFAAFMMGIGFQFLAFTFQVGLFGIGLEADRDILTGCHRHGARTRPATPATRMALGLAPALANAYD